MANMNDRIRVWDLPVRLFHWALVILIFAISLVQYRISFGRKEQA